MLGNNILYLRIFSRDVAYLIKSTWGNIFALCNNMVNRREQVYYL